MSNAVVFFLLCLFLMQFASPRSMFADAANDSQTMGLIASKWSALGLSNWNASDVTNLCSSDSSVKWEGIDCDSDGFVTAISFSQKKHEGIYYY